MNSGNDSIEYVVIQFVPSVVKFIINIQEKQDSIKKQNGALISSMNFAFVTAGWVTHKYCIMPTTKPKVRLKLGKVTPAPTGTYASAPTPIALPLNQQIKQKTWQNARKVIKDEFVADPSPGSMRHA